MPQAGYGSLFNFWLGGPFSFDVTPPVTPPTFTPSTANASGTVVVTAVINGQLTYAQIEQTNLHRTNYEKGVNYSLVLNSGEGIGQINDKWSSIDTIPGSGDIDLTNLIEEVYNQDLRVSFGNDGENAKGIKFSNLSTKVLTMQTPFDEQGIVIYESGSVLISHAYGMSFASGDATFRFASEDATPFVLKSTIVGVGTRGIAGGFGFDFGFDEGFG